MDELPLGQFNNHRLVRAYAARPRYHPISYCVTEKSVSPPPTDLADLDGLLRGFEVKQVRARLSSKLEKQSCLKVRSLSKNHGRVVVLPYIGESGKRAQGHTRNASHDGKALPRLRNDYLELRFEVLKGDPMCGLIGKLNYE